MKKSNNKVMVQLYSWKLYWPYAFNDDYVAKFNGKLVNHGERMIEFETLNEAKRFVESLGGIILLKDESSFSEKFGECIDITYTRNSDTFYGLHYATIWNMNSIDKFFLE